MCIGATQVASQLVLMGPYNGCMHRRDSLCGGLGRLRTSRKRPRIEGQDWLSQGPKNGDQNV